MLDKLGGVFAPRPSTGPHKLRESLPLLIFLRNRLKYALNGAEVTKIVMQRLIKVDGKVRTDPTYPAGFMGKCLLHIFESSRRNLYIAELQMSSPLRRPESSSVWSMTLRDVSPFTVFPLRKPR